MPPSAGEPHPTPVYLELGAKRVFASAADWPGWCRSGKDEERALEALGAASRRYAVVSAEAGVPFPSDAAGAFAVVERIPGSATTDFGAPGGVAAAEADPLTKEEAARQAALVSASWAVFDRVVAGAPAELRKGPRGGGRDRDRIVDHVLDAETAYASKLGVRLSKPDATDRAAVAAHREKLLEALTAGNDEKGWPPRYAARRIAWHALDHAWEIEDRSTPS
jgi:hypothetical protein